ncbi:hypothetical protein V6N13_033798 [Hibiscus sabdariffa]
MVGMVNVSLAPDDKSILAISSVDVYFTMRQDVGATTCLMVMNLVIQEASLASRRMSSVMCMLCEADKETKVTFAQVARAQQYKRDVVTKGIEL